MHRQIALTRLTQLVPSFSVILWYVIDINVYQGKGGAHMPRPHAPPFPEELPSTEELL